MTSRMKNKNTSKVNYYPSALTISCSDSCGGAGIQADLRTFNAYAVYGCCALTSVASMNNSRIDAIQNVSAQLVANQIDTVLEGVPLKFAKSGILPDAEIIRAVAQSVEKHKLKLVVDTVMFSQTWQKYTEKNIYKTMQDTLLKLAYAVTADIAEVEILLDCRIKDEQGMFEAAQKISERFGVLAVVGGGKFEKNRYTADAVAFDGALYQLRSPVLKNCRHTHGASCTMSAALCANLALGAEWDDALLEAKTFVFGSLAEPVRIGDETEVMYPPETDYSEHISLLEI